MSQIPSITSSRRRIRRPVAAALLAAAMLAGAPAAQGAPASFVDLRSPDTRDAATAAQARDYVDLRSPDAQVAGRPAPVQSAPPAPSGTSSGTDWETVGIAGGGLSLALMGLAGLGVSSRRRNARVPVASS